MLRILDIYAEVAEDVMAMPVIKGVKTRAEKFAGALRSYSIEAMMQNGLALQAGTSHDLGQNFGKAFDVQFQTKEGQLDYVWQTSWGVSTRLIGGLIMSHSDDKGLVLPPEAGAGESRAGAHLSQGRGEGRRCSKRRTASRKEIGAKVDDREGQIAGRQVLPLGAPRRAGGAGTGPARPGVGQHRAEAARHRDKEVVPQEESAARLPAVLDAMQKDLYDAAKQRLKANTVTGEFHRRSGSDSARSDRRKGRRQVRDGAPEGRSRLRRAPEGIQGDGAQYSAGGRIRRRRQVHRHRRDGGPPRGDREGVLRDISPRRPRGFHFVGVRNVRSSLWAGNQSRFFSVCSMPPW